MLMTSISMCCSLSSKWVITSNVVILIISTAACSPLSSIQYGYSSIPNRCGNDAVVALIIYVRKVQTGKSIKIFFGLLFKLKLKPKRGKLNQINV